MCQKFYVLFQNLPHPLKVCLRSERNDFGYYILGDASCKRLAKSVEWSWRSRMTIFRQTNITAILNFDAKIFTNAKYEILLELAAYTDLHLIMLVPLLFVN